MIQTLRPLLTQVLSPSSHITISMILFRMGIKERLSFLLMIMNYATLVQRWLEKKKKIMHSLKAAVALKALDYIGDHRIIGIGTGSTVNCFIDALLPFRARIDACVSSSEQTTARLKNYGFTVLDLNVVDDVPIYIDGADECDAQFQMIKGGGGALTREKILASCAQQFICIIDENKWVYALGNFPIAVEVIPMARSFVAREIMMLGGEPIYRPGFITDNGNCILDVHNLDLTHAHQMEQTLNHIPGVVENGLFSSRTADIVLVAETETVSVFSSLKGEQKEEP